MGNKNRQTTSTFHKIDWDALCRVQVTLYIEELNHIDPLLNPTIYRYKLSISPAFHKRKARDLKTKMAGNIVSDFDSAKRLGQAVFDQLKTEIANMD